MLVAAIVAWLAAGAYGVGLGYGVLQARYPTVPDDWIDFAGGIVLTLFGPIALLGALMYFGKDLHPLRLHWPTI